MPTFDDVAGFAAALPGNDQRDTTGGLAWFVRNKVYAWECHPWPSEAPHIRELVASEPVLGVKLPDVDEQRALVQGWPDVFRASEVSWGGPKALVRLNLVDADHLRELVEDAWRTQAPQYLRREFDGDLG